MANHQQYGGQQGWGAPPPPQPPPRRGASGGLVAGVIAGGVLVVALVVGLLVWLLPGIGGEERPGPRAAEGPSAGATDSGAGAGAGSGSGEAAGGTTPAGLVGVWKGTYTCNQGETGLTLTLADGGGTAVTGRFDFYPTATNPQAETGAFNVEGTLKDGRLDLKGTSWIKQPADYQMIDLTSDSVNGEKPTKLNGTIVANTPGCSTFSVKR